MDNSQAMLLEIKEQPSLLKDIWERRNDITKEFVCLCKSHPIKKVVFVGNGSPYYAGCTLRYAAEKFLRAETDTIISSLFNNHTDFNISGKFNPDEILLICPAESGHSKGQVDAAIKAKKAGISVMSTTLNANGILARYSDVVLEKKGSHEIAMAATKGQTMSLYMILLNLIEAGYSLGTITKQEYTYYMNAAAQVPRNIEHTVSDTEIWFKANIKRISEAENYWIIGYGANYGNAQEASLKFLECHLKPTFALELEESLHGPFRAVRKNDLILFISAEEGYERNRMRTLADAAAGYCDNCILIQSNMQDLCKNSLVIHSTDVEFINTIEYLIPLQMLSYLIADQIGIDTSIPLVSELDAVMIPGYSD